MKSLFLLQITLLSCALFSSYIFAQKDDQRPGSRGLYVANHSEEIPDLLEVRLRQCRCQNKEEKRACDCWTNFSDKDKPEFQGFFGELQILMKMLGVKQPYLKDSDPALVIPSPPYLYELLAEKNCEDFFVFLESNTLLDDDQYLAFIADGKIPIATIAKGKLAYQTYFHDLANHVTVWLALPHIIHLNISVRLSSFLELSRHIEKSFAEDEEVMMYWKLLKHMLAIRIDSSHANVNNIFVRRIIRISRKGHFRLTTKEIEVKKNDLTAYLEGLINIHTLLTPEHGESDIHSYTSVPLTSYLNCQHLLLRLEKEIKKKKNHFLNSHQEIVTKLSQLDALKLTALRMKTLSNVRNHLGISFPLPRERESMIAARSTTVDEMLKRAQELADE